MKKKKQADTKKYEGKKEPALKKDGENLVREKEFEAFVWWRSIPAILRRTLPEKLNELGFDTEDAIFMKLLSIKSRTAFAREFEVSIETLTDWSVTTRFKNEVQGLIERYNVLPFEKDMAFHFTQAAIRDADAPRVKLWYQIFKQWQEKSTVKLTDPISELLDAIYRERQQLVKPESASPLGPGYGGGLDAKDKG